MSTHIAVIGAGVIGLSTAIKIQEKGHQVTIIAEHLPGDPKNIDYTSPWAGAHHVGSARSNEPQGKIEQETFAEMWAMSEPNHEASQCFKRITHVDYYEKENESITSCLDVMPEFRRLQPAELVPGATSGLTFKTITIDTPSYLQYLIELFKRRGGNVERVSVQHISQVIDGGYLPGNIPPNAVVVCAGIGARRLGGVEDKDVFPIRGQIILIRAPWIESGMTFHKTDRRVDIMPRRSGDVIIGGTREVDDWYPHPRPDTTKDILSRALELCPDLAPPEIRNRRTPAVEDLEAIVIEAGCGLRPGRKGGVRLDADQVKSASGKLIPVVYNYGHGGNGYILSWGSATVAVDLLQAELALAKTLV